MEKLKNKWQKCPLVDRSGVYVTEVSFFFTKTELSFSAKFVARTVLFPIKYIKLVKKEQFLYEICFQKVKWLSSTAGGKTVPLLKKYNLQLQTVKVTTARVNKFSKYKISNRWLVFTLPVKNICPKITNLKHFSSIPIFGIFFRNVIFQIAGWCSLSR